MLNILRSIADVIKNVIDFFVHTIESFLNLLAAIPKFTAYIFNLVDTIIPDIFKPFIIVSIVAGIILLILGRNN